MTEKELLLKAIEDFDTKYGACPVCLAIAPWTDDNCCGEYCGHIERNEPELQERLDEFLLRSNENLRSK